MVPSHRVANLDPDPELPAVEPTSDDSMAVSIAAFSTFPPSSSKGHTHESSVEIRRFDFLLRGVPCAGLCSEPARHPCGGRSCNSCCRHRIFQSRRRETVGGCCGHVYRGCNTEGAK